MRPSLSVQTRPSSAARRARSPPARPAAHAQNDRTARSRASPAEGEAVSIRVFDDPAAIDAAAWDALVDAQPSATPFMRLAYLRALHESASAVDADRLGSRSSSLLERDGALRRRLPALPQGPFLRRVRVRLGLGRRLPAARPRYYPKLLDAVPFTPVPGPRLLARDARAIGALLLRGDAAARAPTRSSRRRTCSSSTRPTRRPRAKPAGCCAARCSSTGRNREPEPYADFADFLASCSATSARRSSRSGAGSPRPASTFTALEGAAIAPADWDFFYRCYTLTYREHHSTPYLTRDFFARMARDDGRELAALRRLGAAGERIAASLIAIDPARRAAFGRYWGATEHVSLPALRRLLLPAARLVHRQRLPALRGRRAGRAQDGARPAAGADLVGALARASAVRARGRRFPRARRRGRRELPRRAERAPAFQGRSGWPRAGCGRVAQERARPPALACSSRCRSRISSRAASGPSQP